MKTKELVEKLSHLTTEFVVELVKLADEAGHDREDTVGITIHVLEVLKETMDFSTVDIVNRNFKRKQTPEAFCIPFFTCW